MIVLLLCFGIYKNNRLTVPVKINDIEQFFIKTTDAVAIISDSFQIFTIGRAY